MKWMLAACVVLVGLFGCRESRYRPSAGGPHITHTGVVRRLALNQPVVTTDIHTVFVEDRSEGRKFFAVVGPNDTTPVTYKIVKNSPTTYQISSGWIYVNGKMPVVRTDRIEAAGEGTEFIVQQVAEGGTTYHRVFFTGGTPLFSHVDVSIYPLADPDPVGTLTDIGTYIQVDGDDTSLPQPQDIKDSPFESWVAEVLSTAAGVSPYYGE